MICNSACIHVKSDILPIVLTFCRCHRHLVGCIYGPSTNGDGFVVVMGVFCKNKLNRVGESKHP